MTKHHCLDWETVCMRQISEELCEFSIRIPGNSSPTMNKVETVPPGSSFSPTCLYTLTTTQTSKRTRNLGSSKRDTVAHLPESSGFIQTVTRKWGFRGLSDFFMQDQVALSLSACKACASSSPSSADLWRSYHTAGAIMSPQLITSLGARGAWETVVRQDPTCPRPMC